MTETIDRFGKPVRVGFATHEILWILAANELPPEECAAALADIASMTARPLRAICTKATQLLPAKPPAPPPAPKVQISWRQPPRPGSNLEAAE